MRMTPQNIHWVIRLWVDWSNYLEHCDESSFLATLPCCCQRGPRLSQGEDWGGGGGTKGTMREQKKKHVYGRYLGRPDRTNNIWTHFWRVSKSLPSQQARGWQHMAMRQHGKRNRAVRKCSIFGELLKGQNGWRVRCWLQRKNKRAGTPENSVWPKLTHTQNRLAFLSSEDGDGYCFLCWALYSVLFIIIPFEYHNNPHLELGKVGLREVK